MMDNRLSRAADSSTVFLRFALGVSFLSAVADRFGSGELTDSLTWLGEVLLVSLLTLES
jgi:class 3 adenylate cyclase